MDDEIMFFNKKGQVAIWVIIAIALSLVLALVLFIQKKPATSSSIESNIEGRIGTCIKDLVEEASDKMTKQGGFVNPESYKEYRGTNVTYLCQNIGYYKPCVNQHPVLIKEIKKEIENYITNGTKECFDLTLEEFRGNNYEVTEGEMNLSVLLYSNKIDVIVKKEIELKKDESIRKYSEFSIENQDPIYDLAKVALEIAKQEASYCYFEYLGYSILYPEFSIRRFVFSDYTEIYTITHKKTNREMNVAIRGCAIPSGI